MSQATGTLRLLYSPIGRNERLMILVGIALSAMAGSVPTLMAKVIGVAFNAFTQFNKHSLPIHAIPSVEKQVFMKEVVQLVWKLLLLGGGTMVLSTSMISVWTVIGEHVARGWRLKIYKEMSSRSMSWYDVDLKSNVGQEVDQDVGVGGLIAKFARETDEIRIATSHQMGLFVETSATVVASVCMAMYTCWSLALVVLSVLPITMASAHIIQARAVPLHYIDSQNTALAAKELEQSIQAIHTVKTLCMESQVKRQFMQYVEKSVQAWNHLAFVYGTRMGVTAFLTLTMFTSGFWYGSTLVQEGKISPGNVLTTFWSCLLVGNAVTTLLQQYQTIGIGKVAAASLTNLTKENDVISPASMKQNFSSSATTASDNKKGNSIDRKIPSPDSKAHLQAKPCLIIHKRAFTPIQKIRPNVCRGEVTLISLTFSYPSRPQKPVLKDIDMFFPAGEATFIVGGSGSGKSTISHLLLGLYDQYSGSLLIDEQDSRYLDPSWIRKHVGAVEQNAIIFDMSVHDNIALGMYGKGDAAIYKSNHVPCMQRARVEDVCRMVMLDRDVSKMTLGYDTKLGSEGVDLSGGQKQRLALARSIVRDPTILVLDESTSALDMKIRLLVMEMIKKWRRGRTTIIITHDLSQVGCSDFVYLLEKGRVAEEGYRQNLENRVGSIFCKLLSEQELSFAQDATKFTSITELEEGTYCEIEQEQVKFKHSRASRWNSNSSLDATCAPHETCINSSYPKRFHYGEKEKQNPKEWILDLSTDIEGFPDSSAAPKVHVHRRSQSSQTSVSSSSSYAGLRPLRLAESRQEEILRLSAIRTNLEMASVAVSMRRPDVYMRRAWMKEELKEYEKAVTAMDDSCATDEEDKMIIQEPCTARIPPLKAQHSSNLRSLMTSSSQFWNALCQIFLTTPKRTLLVFALLTTVAGAAVQPTFSFLLGHLLATMGQAHQGHNILTLSLAVLALAIFDGFVQLLRFALLQYSANVWIRTLRQKAISNVFLQDKVWFDRGESSSPALVMKLIKDGEDAKSFISRILGELVLVVFLLAIVLVWSMIVSWRLTLAGLALGPLFYLVIAAQSNIMRRFEKQNRLQRERVAKRFYSMVRNIRAIRAMGLDELFYERFYDAVHWTTRHGRHSAPLMGFGYGLKDCCLYLSQALLYYVGAVLIARGLLTVTRMFIVFNLVVFGVTYASQILAYLPQISKATHALEKFLEIVHLGSDQSSELNGHSKPYLHGSISFDNVCFSYPTRPDNLVLDGCSFSISAGETVALVGQSGCGKSTVSALLQRLYEPASGIIRIDDKWPLKSIDTTFLRRNLACVSQESILFDGTIRSNIALGHECATPAKVQTALEKACCLDFVQELDNGMDTTIGEQGKQLSGGQKQRICIARALVRDDAKIRILDECTSALDVTNQARLAQNVLQEAKGPTTIVITHNLEMMKRCDRILVLDNGKVVQSGTYTALVHGKGGAFSKLAHAGAWGS